MGWSCQHDYKGYCKRVERPCVPGMKGCTLQSSDYIFSGELEPKKEEECAFAQLLRTHQR